MVSYYPYTLNTIEIQYLAMAPVTYTIIINTSISTGLQVAVSGSCYFQSAKIYKQSTFIPRDFFKKVTMTTKLNGRNCYSNQICYKTINISEIELFSNLLSKVISQNFAFILHCYAL